MIEYKGVMLDSSWELILAQKLDADGVKWLRPNPLLYEDKKGTKRHYFPDFYLPDFDVYLDPKNPAAFVSQQEKIDCLKEQITNLVFLHSVEEILKYKP